MQNMNFDRIGDDLGKACAEGYKKGLEEGYKKGLEEAYQKVLKEQVPIENVTCDDEGNCIPSTVLESFKEETWEE